MSRAAGVLVIAGLGVAPIACAVPVDSTQDSTSTRLVHEPIHLFEIVVDRGSIDAVSYDRKVITLKRHVFGFTSQLGPSEETIKDGVLRFEAHCIGTDHCTWDHMLELPPGVGFNVRYTSEAVLDFGRIDRDITAEFESGRFGGSRLASPHLTITADSADVVLDFAAVPEAVTIDLGDGDVELAVPAGSYRCTIASDAGKLTIADEVVCDDAATAVLDVQLGSGDIKVTTAAAP